MEADQSRLKTPAVPAAVEGSRSLRGATRADQPCSRIDVRGVRARHAAKHAQAVPPNCPLLVRQPDCWPLFVSGPGIGAFPHGPGSIGITRPIHVWSVALHDGRAPAGYLHRSLL